MSTHFKWVREILKYCDVSKHVNTTKLQKGQKTLHPIPLPVKVWSQIGIDLLGPLKAIDGYKYIVTALDYISKFVQAESLKTWGGSS